MRLSNELWLVALMLSGIASPVAAQSAASIPMQRGISVELPAAGSAITLPEADKEDAAVVAVTANGEVFWGTDRITPSALSLKLKQATTGRMEKPLYIKADARTPYAAVVKVLDAMHASGVEEITLLTDQRTPGERGKLVSPQGLEMRLLPAGKPR